MDSSTEDNGPEESEDSRPGDIPSNKADSQRQPRTSNAVTKPQRRASRSRDTIPYRSLLNSHISEVVAGEHDSHPLPSSQIGGSFWSSSEKSILFNQLSLHGPGQIRQLAGAIGTKSEPEVKAYVSLLDTGVREFEATSRTTNLFTLSEVPAVTEVGSDLERILDEAGNDLSHRVFDAESRAERKQYGEWWRIDTDAAAELEKLAGPAVSAEPGSTSADKGSSAGHNDSGESQTFSPDQSSLLPVPAAALLRPESFLNLSQSLFMNSADPNDSNWHSLTDAHDERTGPAIFRTAFDDFHNLTVSITRRLVQTTIFQATSRLRAHADERTSPNVHGKDVRAALDILGMPPNAKQYWATAARRCKVDVYTESSKYRDGRPTTKAGVKLTWDETEAALGLTSIDDRPEPRDDDLSDGAEFDSEAYTDISGSEDAHDSSSSSENGVSVKSDTSGAVTKPTKRKRALSPRSYDRAEDEYLDALDQHGSLAEEARLREALGLEKAPISEGPVPAQTFKRARVESRPRHWSEQVQYAPPWAVYDEQPQPVDFERMGHVGEMKRQRRQQRRQTVAPDAQAGAGVIANHEQDVLDVNDAETAGEDSSGTYTVDSN